MILRQYQSDLVDAVRCEVSKGNRRILTVLPTGGGKSHVIGEIASRAISKGHKILALMHRRQLVSQLTGFFQQSGVDPGQIMAGEDLDLDKMAQVATCQTYQRRLALLPIDANHFYHDATIVFIDEAHHALSKTYQKILSNYDNRIVIGVTATPVLSSGVGMGNYFDSLVHLTSVGDLIKDGHLVPGIYYGPSEPDLSKLKTVAGDYAKGELNKVMNTPKLVGDVVANWLRFADGRQTFVFAVKVSHSKAIRDAFLSRGIPAEHLDAHAEDEERSDVLRRFRGGDTRVVTNVGLYTEGTDVPEIQAVILARPTKSLGLHLQMIGRGARPYPGKKDFIVLDHGGNIARLGYYEDDIEWSLDGKELGYKKKPRKKDKKIRTCPECCYLYTGARCPQCGYKIPDYRKLIEAEEAELVKLNGKKKSYSMADKRRWFAMLDHERRLRGYAKGWTAHKYREKFKVWPVGMENVGPLEPDEAVRNWIKYQRIRYAKGKAKAA